MLSERDKEVLRQMEKDTDHLMEMRRQSMKQRNGQKALEDFNGHV